MPARLPFNPQQHTQNGNSFALWRLPQQNLVSAVVCKTVKEFLPVFFEQETQGFAFAPFDSEGTTPSLFLEGDILTDVDTTATTHITHYHQNKNNIAIDTPAHYTANVQAAVNAIKSGNLKKVVIARNTLWAIPEQFCPLTFFNTLCATYPEAMVSLVSIPNIGTWIGATPELLLKVDKQHLNTVALAGTQLKNDAQWTEKESEEQLWVVRYIEDILQRYQVNHIDIAARKLIRNGNLEHLYTQIAFSKEGVKNTTLAAQLLPLLHPTPAVGGLDKNEAIRFIIQHEGFDRSYYSGFLGELNQENAQLFVNLRCMQLTPIGLVGYAGAGITKDSDPDNELQETENKLKNLKSLLN